MSHDPNISPHPDSTPPPSDNRVYLSLCHDDQNQGKTLPDGWSERRLARVVLDASVLVLREEGIHAWTVSGGTLGDRIRTLSGLSVAPVVEVHFDSLPQRTEVAGYFAIVDNANRAAQELGDKILDSMAAAFPERRSMGLCRADEHHRWIGTPKEYDGTRLGLLHDLPRYPVVIVEACFLTNPGEAKWIKKIENRLALGAAIARGIAAYCRGMSSTRSKTPGS
jgi:N-acetylmuramoyl-L-alanine amidase